jgi:hypothetical protein
MTIHSSDLSAVWVCLDGKERTLLLKVPPKYSSRAVELGCWAAGAREAGLLDVLASGLVVNSVSCSDLIYLLISRWEGGFHWG